MPLFFAVLLAALAPNSSDVFPAPPANNSSEFDAKRKCVNATTEHAHQGAVLRTNPARPQKLTELPPAETYAAVYRLENGCAVPVLYRETREVRPPNR